MESGGSTSSTLKKRGHARKKDTISNKLPESIITDILSLLPMKEAVRACVLSKRWIHRWTSITKLELDDSELQSCYSFCSFCNRQCILASFENVKGIPTFYKENLSSVVVPDCLVSSLQVLKFENVNGDEHELVLAKFFIENSTILEKVDLSLAASPRSNKYKVVSEFKEMVYSFRKDVCLSILNF
ncbi:hypothetical protein TSUD_272940 [Trifolium subterraneum]|uniref:FBD domain-containing protein n=1 Tax=Trifolium subterraneum TaxID=3900 RepID=A0A2Z6P5V7_TRISU|nr:hypothetical protein TSUD_272940 [Trifolium subterraneum]